MRTALLFTLLSLVAIVVAADPAVGTMIALVLGGFFAYFVPAMVASGREGAAGPATLNLFLGWTGLGWLGALVWAVSLPQKGAPETERYERLADGTFRRVAS